MLAIVVSRADEASELIGDRLLTIAEWTEHDDPTRADEAGGGTYYRTDGAELRIFEELHLHLDNVANVFDDPEMLVFASRHSGETGPLLTAHATGNFGSAEYGGSPGELAEAAPNALRVVRDALERFAPEDFVTGIECTHHGPSDVGCPSLFVEVGSAEPQWRDPDAATAVARAILKLRGIRPNGDRTVVGFGGGHYAPRFDRILMETDWGVGHIAADWVLKAMGEPADSRDLLLAACEASGADRALVDGTHSELVEVLEDLGIEVRSETFLRETTNVPLGLVNRIESKFGTVEEGIRFGGGVQAYEDEIHIEELPSELLEEVNGIERAAVIDILENHAIAYGTTEGGTLASGRVAFADRSAYRTVIEAFAELLEDKYDEIEIGESEIDVRRAAFDPERARAAGVDPGPEFGRLAEGEPVEVDGEQIDPEDVRTVRKRRFEF